jgi:hypothetical protein
MFGLDDAIGALGFGMQLAGTISSFVGSQQRDRANRQIGQLQNQQTYNLQLAADQQTLQMNLDANRKKREAIRQGQVASAKSENAAYQQGAGNSSGEAGAQGNIAGAIDNQIHAVNQSQEIGNTIANYNRIAAFQGARASSIRASNPGGELSEIGSGLSSLGGGLVRNEGTISRVGSYIGGFGGS